MRRRHPSFATLPRLWLVTDARNDALLEPTIARLPRGSGMIFRHGHLLPPERRARFTALARLIRGGGGLAVLAGTMAQARRWRADGAYGPPALIAPGPCGLRLSTAHTMREIARARRADALLLSPAFPTRSHPGAAALGLMRWRLLASHSLVPTIALGGMNSARARRLGTDRWAAIDGLTFGRAKMQNARAESQG